MHCGNCSARNKACNVWRIAITFETQQNQLFYNSFFFWPSYVLSLDEFDLMTLAGSMSIVFLIVSGIIFRLQWNQFLIYFSIKTTSDMKNLIAVPGGILDDKRVEVIWWSFETCSIGTWAPNFQNWMTLSVSILIRCEYSHVFRIKYHDQKYKSYKQTQSIWNVSNFQHTNYTI